MRYFSRKPISLQLLTYSMGEFKTTKRLGMLPERLNTIRWIYKIRINYVHLFREQINCFECALVIASHFAVRQAFSRSEAIKDEK